MICRLICIARNTTIGDILGIAALNVIAVGLPFLIHGFGG